MRPAEVLDEMARDLDFARTPQDVVMVAIPEGNPSALPRDNGSLRELVIAGLFDLVVEAVAADTNPGEARERVADALSRAQSIIPVARFALFERADIAERKELAARVRGREVALKRSWLVPRLEEDIRAYQARIGALRQALEEA